MANRLHQARYDANSRSEKLKVGWRAYLRYIFQGFFGFSFFSVLHFNRATCSYNYNSDQSYLELLTEGFVKKFQHVFKIEEEDHTKEEIDWNYIELVYNQDVLNLFVKRLKNRRFP